MRHEDAMEHLDAFCDGELAAPLKGEMEGHVKECGECAAALAERAALTERLARLIPPRPAEGFVEGVLNRIDAPRPAPRWLVPAFATGLAAASVLIVFGLSPVDSDSSEKSADILWAGENNGTGKLQAIDRSEKMSADQVLSFLLEAS